MSGDSRKITVYLPASTIEVVHATAERLDRSVSWVVARCVEMNAPLLVNEKIELARKRVKGA